jgi:hypothetical protein
VKRNFSKIKYESHAMTPENYSLEKSRIILVTDSEKVQVSEVYKMNPDHLNYLQRIIRANHLS